MKTVGSFLLLFFLVISLSAQTFELKSVDSKKLKKQFEDSNYQANIIVNYLKEHYKSTSDKTNVLYDSEMGGIECGYTLKFEHGIEYTYHQCGVESPAKEKVIFPKLNDSRFKKWIENIEKANSSAADTANIWYKNENEYGPKDEGVGCYYKILSSKDKSIVEISCGC